MKKTYILFIFSIFVLLTGCEDKKSQKPAIAVENTTEIFTPEDRASIADKKRGEPNDTLSVTQNTQATFTLKNREKNSLTVGIGQKSVSISSIDAHIVIINLFDARSPSCKGMMPYLSDLQEKHKKKLFVIGVPVYNDADIDTFVKEKGVNYFIANDQEGMKLAKTLTDELKLSESFSLPLTILYKHGQYITHYEDAVPVEMLEHDIQEIIK